MGFDAASARAASAGLGALAQRARENGQTILKAAHDACRLPEDRVGHGFRAGATAFLGSPEGKAALRKGLEAAWALIRGIVTGPAPAPQAGAVAADASAANPSAAAPERSGPLA
jgi:hypothetical protein